MARSASIEVEKPYHQVLQTLSEGSVARSFDPYLDIDWDSPEFAIDPHDPRWVLSSVSDPLGATQWYQDQSLERRIAMGMWRQANVTKVGSAFESILIRGMLQYIMALPNQSPEFRYCLHEMTEECNHIQMFQELVNRMDIDVPGMRPMFRRLSPIIGVLEQSSRSSSSSAFWLVKNRSTTSRRISSVRVRTRRRRCSAPWRFTSPKKRDTSRLLTSSCAITSPDSVVRVEPSHRSPSPARCVGLRVKSCHRQGIRRRIRNPGRGDEERLLGEPAFTPHPG